MGSKKEVSIGDYVIHKHSGRFVCDDEGNPVKVVRFTLLFGCDGVVYENSDYDFIEDVEKASSLVLELL